MTHVELLIIGAGPAGLKAALEALKAGSQVTLIERSHVLGGQLSKQTHKFFGSEKQHASKRGIHIMTMLIEALEPYRDQLTIHLETHVVSLYSDYVVGCVKGETYFKLKAEAIIVATGASEKALPFENNDLPGVYAAGAVQTLMNQYGVKPGHKVLMVGSGNIGLIVSYQLMQAGIQVVALVEAAPSISGYLVHASKLRRLGVPIFTQTSIKTAHGETSVNGATLWQLDEAWQGLQGSETFMEVDTICISVGLSPLSDLLAQMGAEVRYVRELGGNVPVIDAHYQTTLEKVYACGDVTGIEEASSAMVEGALVGLVASAKLGHRVPDLDTRIHALKQELTTLRMGPHAEKLRTGYAKLEGFDV